MQDNSYKDKLIIVNQDLVGAKDRGAINNNAVISNSLIEFHPMVRDNWGTEDPLRGILGSYYTRYNSSKGEALYSYSNALRAIKNGYAPPDFDHSGESFQQEGIGPLRNQLIGNGPNGTNIVFTSSYSQFGDSVRITAQLSAWDGYSSVSGDSGNNSVWLAQNLEEYALGDLKYSADQLMVINDLVTDAEVVYQGLLNTENFENKVFIDHTSEHFLLSGDRALREKSGVLTGVEPVYNYYANSNPDYEDVIANSKVEEYLIPNAYYLQLELRNTSSTVLKPYHIPAIQFGGGPANFPPVVVAETPTGPVSWFKTENFGNTEANIGSYYNLYSDGMASRIETLPEANKNYIRSINSDIAILNSDIKVLDPESIDTTNIPFYNKITISRDTKDAAGPSPFLGDVYSNPSTSNFVDMLQALAIVSYHTQPQQEQFSTRYQIFNNADNLSDFTFSSNDIGVPVLFDLGEHLTPDNASLPFWKSLVSFYQNNGGVIASIVPNLKFLRDYYGRPHSDLDADVSFEATMASCIYDIGFSQSDLNSEIFKRSLKQIFDNKFCHSETLLYVVEKKNERGQLIQRMFISPDITGDNLSQVYYDSQIKYNTKYQYDFKKVVLIFGNEYTYPNKNNISVVGSPAHPQGSILVDGIQNVPSIKAVLVPYTTEDIEVLVIDKPPVSPNISFYPVKGDSQNIKILLNASTGDYDDIPIQILDSDSQFYEEEYLGQTGINKSFEDIRSENRRIRFKSDDPVDRYQLFRINSIPTSYRDFKDTLIDIDPEIGIVGYYQDTILQNIKYYYCARSVDVHGNISNPTYIFEIEIINNDGQVFLRQEVFTFEQSKPHYTINGRRFLYIEPSFNQVALENVPIAPSNTEVAPQDNILGITEQDKSCWNKTFKVRVTSKKTGKKLDLNITFKNSGVTNPS